MLDRIELFYDPILINTFIKDVDTGCFTATDMKKNRHISASELHKMWYDGGWMDG